MTTSQKILAVSAGFIIAGSLGIAFVYSRAKARRRKAKELSIQIV